MIQAQNLTMHYGRVVALKDASFSVKAGEVVGLLGPNGAGKSTAMKILTTYLYPTAGTAKVGGKDVRTEPMAVRKLIGYLPEVLPLYMDMEVIDYLRFVARGRGVARRDMKTRLDWVVEKTGLRRMLRRPIRELSKGYKQRTALAQALVHDPEVIILDEPTSGLDPHQIIEIRRLIRKLGKEKTIIASTHILHEVEAISDRVVIINRGRIVADGTIAELAGRAQRQKRIELVLDGEATEVIPSLSRLEAVKDVRELEPRGDLKRYEVAGPREAKIGVDVYCLARDRAWQVAELKETPFSLEETFLALTRAEAQEAAS